MLHNVLWSFKKTIRRGAGLGHGQFMSCPYDLAWLVTAKVVHRKSRMPFAENKDSTITPTATNLESWLSNKVQTAWHHALIQHLNELLVLVCKCRGESVEPGKHVGLPTKHGGLHVHHTTTGHRGWWGDLEVHWLKDEIGSRWELNDLTTHEAELQGERLIN